MGFKFRCREDLVEKEGKNEREFRVSLAINQLMVTKVRPFVMVLCLRVSSDLMVRLQPIIMCLCLRVNNSFVLRFRYLSCLYLSD